MEVVTEISPIKKNKRGKIVTYPQKLLIVNLYKSLVTDHSFDYSYGSVVRNISTETGIGRCTVYKILNEYTSTGSVTPTVCKRRLWAKHPDAHEATAIRKKVHQFFRRNEQPTIRKLVHVVNSDETLGNYKKSKFHSILRELGFCYLKRNRSILLERDDLIKWRQSYLLDIQRYREQRRKIYYLDETWVNEGHTRSKCWLDTTVKSAKDAFLRGLSVGLSNPSGKGKRLIILHIGNEDGFVDGGALVFESNKTSDYHEEMTGAVFNDWFEQVLELLEPGSVIVLDNASYHSVKKERIPTSSANKSTIQQWLNSKGIVYEETDLKKDLLATVNTIRADYDQYIIDDMAKSKGFKVLRLPPYHCELNPIELIWADIKSRVAQCNTTFKLTDLKLLLEEAMSRITPDVWKKCCLHVQNKVEPKMREVDGILVHPVQPVIINFSDSDDEDDEFLDLFPEALEQ